MTFQGQQEQKNLNQTIGGFEQSRHKPSTAPCLRRFQGHYGSHNEHLYQRELEQEYVETRGQLLSLHFHAGVAHTLGGLVTWVHRGEGHPTTPEILLVNGEGKPERASVQRRGTGGCPQVRWAGLSLGFSSTDWTIWLSRRSTSFGMSATGGWFVSLHK